MINLVIVILLLIIAYYVIKNVFGKDYMKTIKYCKNRARQMQDSSDETLNDMVYENKRAPTYDDTSRISNKLFWLSDYSHPQYDAKKGLHEDVITPIRPVSSNNSIKYFSGMHKMSRFGCEKSS